MTGQFAKHPKLDGWVLGWAVVRNSPWHLAAFYNSRAEADAHAAKLPGYDVRHGAHKEGTDDFIEE